MMTILVAVVVFLIGVVCGGIGVSSGQKDLSELLVLQKLTELQAMVNRFQNTVLDVASLSSAEQTLGGRYEKEFGDFGAHVGRSRPTGPGE